MKTEFELLISFRTPAGFKVCGQYFLGSDPEIAEDIFAGLTGYTDMNDKAMLHLDLMEISDGIPLKIKTLSCRLSELCANCEYITRELFRVHAVSQATVHPLSETRRLSH